MAADKSRKPTPRKRGSKGASRPAGASVRASAPAAPKKTAPAKKRPRVSLPTGGKARPKSAAQAPSAAPRERRMRHQRANVVRVALTVLASLVALAVVVTVAFFAMRNSSVLAITSIEFEPTEHVSSEDVQNLARVPEGATLLNVDTAAIEESLKKNPWIASASFSRIPPGTLKITVEERRPAALVVMSSGTVAWYLSEDNTWIEPAKLEPAEGQSVNDAALAIAQAQGCLLIADVPSTVDPKAGSAATDEVLDAVRQFQDGFSSDFASQVVCYSAPSAENVSCVLESGVEVSLGSPTEITLKEGIVSGYLEQSDGQVVRINVRVPSNPAYRVIDSDNVQAGDGVSTQDEGSEE